MTASATAPHVLSWSRIETLRTCALRYRRRYLDHAPAAASAPLERGSGFHDWALEVGQALHEGRELDETTLLRVLEQRAALLEDDAAEDLRAIVQRVVERALLPRFPSDAQDVGFERPFALRADGSACEWSSAEAFFRGIIDQHFRENGGALAVVRDFKTSRVVSQPAGQMRAYSWAAACLWPDAGQVLPELHFVRYGAVRKPAEPFVAAELRATVPGELQVIRQDLDRRLAAGDWAPRVSSACRWCEYRPSCPEFEGEVKPLRVIETAAEAVAGAQQLAVLKAQVGDLTDALRGWALQHGAIDLGEEVLGFLPAEKTHVADVRTAARILRQHVTDVGLWDALSLSQTSLGKLLTSAVAGAPRTERRVRKDDLREELRAAGALETTIGTEFTRAAKEEADDVD